MTGTGPHLPGAVGPRRERGPGRRVPAMRAVLVTALAAVAAGAAAVVGIGAALWLGADVDTVGDRRFERRLRIPPLLEPHVDRVGRKVFDLGLRRGRTELLPGTTTATWGINGPHLGPTLRAARGDTVQMRVRNSLPEATTLHWHGMHLPAAADGGPHQRIEPRDTWSPSWTIDQPAATLWYHPHLMGRTADHVYRGLAGLFLIDDPQANGLALPSAYGVDDIPLIIQDERLDDDARLDFGQGMISPIGRLGDEILINGTRAPYLDVRHRLVRLRLLNASTARIYNIGFADGRRFELIATDGGLLTSPEPMTRIQLSVGERAEILVALDAGERAVLRSLEPELGTNAFEGRFSGADDTFDLLEMRAGERLGGARARPATLVPYPERPDRDRAQRVRRFRLGSRDINELKMDMARIDEVVRVGDTEIWEVENTSGTPHSFHVHDVRFRVIEYAGRPPPPQLSGLKDTVYVPPGETVRFVTSFEDYGDPKTPYMFHCHILEHEDRGMMGQFVIAGTARPPEHESHPMSP
jgi:FtsP/CotA-like multicopper oxidase with cupredoxin domain